jgi:hypothetical protein
MMVRRDVMSSLSKEFGQHMASGVGAMHWMAFWVLDTYLVLWAHSFVVARGWYTYVHVGRSWRRTMHVGDV